MRLNSCGHFQRLTVMPQPLTTVTVFAKHSMKLAKGVTGVVPTSNIASKNVIHLAGARTARTETSQLVSPALM